MKTNQIELKDRFIRSKELTKITGLSLSTLWRLENESQFPQRRQLSPGAVGWLWSEILEWLESRQKSNAVEGL